MKLLHIDSSILGANSVSRQVSAAAVAQLKAAHPGIETTYRDLVADPLPHLTLDNMGDHSLVDEFLASDIVVIGAPMYNFNLSTQLKAWIDRVLVSGKTFRYSAAGPEGLAGGKRVIVALSRGGIYSGDAPAAAFEHAESYLKVAFGFIGVTDVEFILAEGIQVGPEVKEKAVAGALAAAGALELKAAA